MPQANVVTPWVGAGTAMNPYRPQLHDDYPGLTWTDTTGLSAGQFALGGQTGSVNVQCSQATLDNIMANPTYAGHVTVIL
jgi:hypothetical protein